LNNFGELTLDDEDEVDEPIPPTGATQEATPEKLIDDVYDVNAVKSNYELRSLRKDWVLDYMSLMEMQ
jgi:hypothetical protein